MKELAAEKADDSRLTVAGSFFYLAGKPLFYLKERHYGFAIWIFAKIDPWEQYERTVENTGQNRGRCA